MIKTKDLDTKQENSYNDTTYNTLSAIQKDMLETIDWAESEYGFAAKNNFNCSRDQFYYNVHKLIEKGLVLRKPGSSFYIILTKEGKEVLKERRNRSGGGREIPKVRTHNLTFKLKILHNAPSNLNGFIMNNNMKNWVEQTKCINGDHIQVTSKHINFKISVPKTATATDAIMKAWEILLGYLKEIVELNPGFRVATPNTTDVITTQHHAYDLPTRFGLKWKACKIDEFVEIDFSQGVIPEIECVHPILAQGHSETYGQFTSDVATGKFDWKKMQEDIHELKETVVKLLQIVSGSDKELLHNHWNVPTKTLGVREESSEDSDGDTDTHEKIKED